MIEKVTGIKAGSVEAKASLQTLHKWIPAPVNVAIKASIGEDLDNPYAYTKQGRDKITSITPKEAVIGALEVGFPLIGKGVSSLIKYADISSTSLGFGATSTYITTKVLLPITKYALESPLLRATAKTALKQGVYWGTFNVASDVALSTIYGNKLTPEELTKSFTVGFASGAAFTGGTAALGRLLTPLTTKGNWVAKIGQQAANGELKGLSRIKEWPANALRNVANFGTAEGITALPQISLKGAAGFAAVSPVFTLVGAGVNYGFNKDVTQLKQSLSPQSFLTNAIGMSLGSGTLKYDQTAGTFVQDLGQGFRFDNRGGAFWGPAIGVTSLPTSVFTGSSSRIAQAIEVNAMSPGARGIVDTLKILSGKASPADISKTLLYRAANPSAFWNAVDHVVATGSVGAWLGVTENVALKLGASPQTASNLAFISLFFKPAAGANQMLSEIAGVKLDVLDKQKVDVFKLEPGTFSANFIKAMQGIKTQKLEQKLYKDARTEAKKNGLNLRIDPLSSGQINAKLGLEKSPFVVVGENPCKLDILGITDPATGKMEFVSSPKGQDSLKQHLEVLQGTATSKEKSPYYAVLGVEMGATPKEIKDAFAKLVFETHSDTGKGGGDSERFDKIIQAKKIIDAVSASPETKRVYDSALKIKDFLNSNGVGEKLNNQGNSGNLRLLVSSAPSLQGVVGEVKEIANKILPMTAAGSEQISLQPDSLPLTKPSVTIPTTTLDVHTGTNILPSGQGFVKDMPVSTQPANIITTSQISSAEVPAGVRSYIGQMSQVQFINNFGVDTRINGKELDALANNPESRVDRLIELGFDQHELQQRLGGQPVLFEKNKSDSLAKPAETPKVDSGKIAPNIEAIKPVILDKPILGPVIVPINGQDLTIPQRVIETLFKDRAKITQFNTLPEMKVEQKFEGKDGQVFVLRSGEDSKIKFVTKIVAKYNLNISAKDEFDITERLKSSNVHVPTIYDLDEKNNILFMEFIEGQKLGDFLKQPHPQEALNELAGKIGVEIWKMHEAGVVHRDLHDQNIMVNDKGDPTFIDLSRSAFFDKTNFEERFQELDRAIDGMKGRRYGHLEYKKEFPAKTILDTYADLYIEKYGVDEFIKGLNKEIYEESHSYNPHGMPVVMMKVALYLKMQAAKRILLEDIPEIKSNPAEIDVLNNNFLKAEKLLKTVSDAMLEGKYSEFRFHDKAELLRFEYKMFDSIMGSISLDPQTKKLIENRLGLSSTDNTRKTGLSGIIQTIQKLLEPQTELEKLLADAFKVNRNQPLETVTRNVLQSAAPSASGLVNKLFALNKEIHRQFSNLDNDRTGLVDLLKEHKDLQEQINPGMKDVKEIKIEAHALDKIIKLSRGSLENPALIVGEIKGSGFYVEDVIPIQATSSDSSSYQISGKEENKLTSAIADLRAKGKNYALFHNHPFVIGADVENSGLDKKYVEDFAAFISFIGNAENTKLSMPAWLAAQVLDDGGNWKYIPFTVTDNGAQMQTEAVEKRFDSKPISKYSELVKGGKDDMKIAADLSRLVMEKISAKLDSPEKQDIVPGTVSNIGNRSGENKNEENISNRFHSELGSYKYDVTGTQWLKFGGSSDYVYGPDYLSEFNLKGAVQNPEKNVGEMIQLLTPVDSISKRFSDHSAIQDFKSSKLEVEPRNLNVDLQLQKRIEQMLKEGFINEETFIIISHGHFISGAVPLVKAKDTEGKYRFDVSIYFPKGKWPSDFNRAKNALNQQYQLWSETFVERHNAAQPSAKGKVVALFGHRGYPNLLGDMGQANVDPYKLFGIPEDFAGFLKKHGFKKVVIITEEATVMPAQIYEIPLSRLKEGDFAENNSDLYEYMNKLSHLTQVQVVTGDMRPPVGPVGNLAQKLGEEDKKQLETVIRDVSQTVVPDTASVPSTNFDYPNEIYAALSKVIEPGQPRPLDKFLALIIERHSLHDKQGNLLPRLEIHKVLASNPLYQNLTEKERAQFLRILDDLRILPLGGLPADKKKPEKVIKIKEFINNLSDRISTLLKPKSIKNPVSDDIITDSLEVGKRLLGKNKNLIRVIIELTGLNDVSRWKVVLEDVIKRQFEQADYRPFVEPITNCLDAIAKGNYLKEVNIIVRDNYVSIIDQAGGMDLGEMMAYVVVPKISGNRGKEGAVAQFGVGFYSLHNLLKKPGEELIMRSYTSASKDGYELVYTYKDDMKIENLYVTVRLLKNIDKKQGTEVLIKSSFNPEMVIKAIKEALSYNQRAKIYVDYNHRRILINDLSPFRLITAENAQALVQEAVFSEHPEVILTVMGVKIFSIPLTGKNIPERLAVELSEPSLVPRARNQIEVNAQTRALVKGLIEEVLARADWRVVNSLTPLLTRLDEENDSKGDKLVDYLDQRLLALAEENKIVFIPDIDELQKAGEGAVLIHPQVFLKLISLGYRPGLKMHGVYSRFHVPLKKLNLDDEANNNIEWRADVNARIYSLEIQDDNIGLVLVSNDEENGPTFLLNKKYLPKTTVGGIVLETLIEFILGQRGDYEVSDPYINALFNVKGMQKEFFSMSASYMKALTLNQFKDNFKVTLLQPQILKSVIFIPSESDKNNAAPAEFSLSLLPFIISEINKQGRSADVPTLKEKLEEINKGEITIKPLGRQYAERDIQTIVDQQNIAPYINIRENGQNTRDEAVRQGRKGKLDIKTEISADKKTIVLKFEDDFGMDAAKLIQFLINPGASDKRQDQQLTGRFGTGFFTNLKGAEAVRVKTSLGNYQVVYASLNPIRNIKQETTDIKVSIRQEVEYYKGTEVEVTLKVKGDSEATVSHILEKAALYLGLIDKNILEITFNGAVLNKGGFADRDLLAQADTAYGKISFYHQKERRAVTHKQLYVTNINEQYVQTIPPLLLKILLKHGIIMDLPEKLELISDRSGLTLSAEKLKELEKATFVAAIKATAKLYIDGLKEVVELFPYDFTDPEKLSSWGARFPMTPEDLRNIQEGNLERLAIDEYTRDEDKLVWLISMIPIYNGLSITELIIAIAMGKISLDDIPLALREELMRERMKLMNKIRGSSNGMGRLLFEKEAIAELSPFDTGILKNYPEFAIYSALAEFLSKTASLLLGKEIKIKFTADLKEGFAAYTWRGGDTIVWNLVGMNRRVEQLSRLLKGTMQIDEPEAKELIGGLILLAAHEATHIPEKNSQLTHNTNFKTKTIELMQKIALENNAQKIVEIIEALKNPQANFVPTSIFTKKMAEDMQIVKHYAQP